MNRRSLLIAVAGGMLGGLVWLSEPVTVPAIPKAEELVPVLIDWSKATDDQRFALLKPVMTLEDVKRLKVGKMDFSEACGTATDARGYSAPAFTAGFSYNLTGRAEPVSIQFHNHGEFQSPDELGKRITQPQASDWGWGGWGQSDWGRGPPAPPLTTSKWTLVAFRADGVLYRRNKEGLYVAEPAK